MEQHMRDERLGETCADQSAQCESGEAGTKQTCDPDKSDDKKDQCQKNSKYREAHAIRKLSPDDRAEIAPQRRARALPFLQGMTKRDREIDRDKDDNEQRRIRRFGHATPRRLLMPLSIQRVLNPRFPRCP